MQEAHTMIRAFPPFTTARTRCRLAFQTRRVTLWAWLMLFPVRRPFPHTSHRLAIE
jgi:hypothetical protein